MLFVLIIKDFSVTLHTELCVFMSNESENNAKKSGLKKGLTTLGLHILLVIAVAMLLLFALSSWLDIYTHHGESVRVPDVIGMVEDDAIRSLEGAGLKAMVIDSVYSESVPRGAVIEQLPEGNLPVKLGRNVYLTVNAKAVRMIQMIDILEYSSRQARSRLIEKGFIVDSIHLVPNEFDDLVVKATLTGQDLEDSGIMAGEEFPWHTHVVLHVGSTRLAIEEKNDSTLEGNFFL